jgi:hypothetical protein
MKRVRTYDAQNTGSNAPVSGCTACNGSGRKCLGFGVIDEL